MAKKVVRQVKLETQNHPKVYEMSWLKKGIEVNI